MIGSIAGFGEYGFRRVGRIRFGLGIRATVCRSRSVSLLEDVEGVFVEEELG